MDSPTPATPQKAAGNLHAGQQNGPATDNSHDHSDLLALNTGEVSPSPASTNGPTATGGVSVPVTPSSASDDLANATSALHLTDASSADASATMSDLDRAFTKPPVYDIEATMARNAHARRINERTFTLSTGNSSPARLTSMVDECIEDRQHGYRAFVQDVSDDGDVFVTKSEVSPEATAPTHSVNTIESNLTVDEHASGAVGLPAYSPRQDRKGQTVTADNAQAHFKPESCIFVANLPNSKTDAEIQGAMDRAFSRFGDCHVKLKRDRGMPIAFVQYHNCDDASDALLNGAGLSILGRKCRTERAKAPRCVYISRRDGNMPAEEEIQTLLSTSGELEKLWAPSETEREVNRLPPGYFARFVYYQDAVEVSIRMRDLETYHVESHQSPKAQLVFDTSSIPSDPQPRSTAPVFNPAKQDDRALWVGDLPENVSKAELARIFGGGRREIAYIDLRIRNAAVYGNKFMSYACIHYTDPQAAYRAAYMTHNNLRLLNGRNVRVQFSRKHGSQLASPPDQLSVGYNYATGSPNGPGFGSAGFRGFGDREVGQLAGNPSVGRLGNNMGYEASGNNMGYEASGNNGFNANGLTNNGFAGNGFAVNGFAGNCYGSNGYGYGYGGNSNTNDYMGCYGQADSSKMMGYYPVQYSAPVASPYPAQTPVPVMARTAFAGDRHGYMS